MYRAIIKEMEASGRTRVEIEMALLGTTHAEIGAYLLALWGVSTPVVEAVCHHHNPARVPHTELCPLGAVYIASTLCRGLLEPGSVAELDMDYLESIGVSGQVEEYRRIAEKIHQDLFVSASD